MLLNKEAIIQQYAKLAKEEQTKSYFSILATLVLLIILLLLISPAIKHITAVNKEISDAKYLKATLEKKLDDLEKAHDSYLKASPNLAVLDLALPVGSDLVSYLKKIESLASAAKLKIETLQFSNVPLSKPSVGDSLRTQKLSYSLSLAGSFPDFKKFLTDLESNVRISEVEILKINKTPGGELKETLNITSYYLGQETLPTSTKSGSGTKTSKSNQPGSGGLNE